jgi:predicted nucleic acid-binding protein
MRSFVVDASVVVKWFLPEEHTELAATLLNEHIALYAPDLLFLEVGSVVWQRARKGSVREEDARAVLDGLVGLDLNVTHSWQIAQSALSLALSTNQTIYDCTYLAVAVERNVPLVTADRKLVQGLQGTALASSVLWLPDLAT